LVWAAAGPANKWAANKTTAGRRKVHIEVVSE
jgi:hypothetical protein